MKEYKIVLPQLNDIMHYAEMFKINADYIKGLCSNKKPDIVYGYELGKIHSHLEECAIQMNDLASAIKNQQINANI